MLDGQTTAEVITWLFAEDSFAPIGKLQGSTRQSILTDHLGTPLAMVDQGEGRSWAAQTTAYGRIRLSEGTRAQCPFRFQGQYEDTETGLYYNRFRYYDPQEGMYVSQDPIKLEGKTALYAYASNTNSWVDIFGLKPCFLTEEGQKYAENIINKHGGQFIKDGHYQFPNRRSARQAASEIAGNLGTKNSNIVTRKSDFRGGPKSWQKSKDKIGMTNANGSSGWRDDILGHDFGQGEVIGSHVNAWNESKGILSNLHLLY